MALFDIDGSGEREYVASAYTMMIYEQEFGGSLIKDVYGKVRLDGDDEDVVTADFVRERLESALPEGRKLTKAMQALVERAFPAQRSRYLDFTRSNWDANMKAMWAMARTADAAAGGTSVPSFKKWMASLGPINLGAISQFVADETQRGLFRAGGEGGE